MKKILNVIGSSDPASGGPIEGLIRSSAAMADHGFVNDVLSLDAPSDPWVSNFPLSIFPMGPTYGKYRYAPRLVPWLSENAKNYHLVVVHGLWNYSSLGTWRGLRSSPVPYVVFAHGMMDPWFRQAYPLKHVAKQLYWWLLEGRVLTSARLVLFTADEERRLARKSFLGHSSYNERVISFGTADVAGVATTQVAMFRHMLPRLGSRRYLLFLGRLHPKKGCDLLLSVFADIAKEFLDVDLVVAGPDVKGWAQELQASCETAGIADRVHWPGLLSGDEKWGALRGAEAFVLPSHQENFGIAVAESMSCSTPVLISNKVNIWREVEQTNSGLVANDDLDGTSLLLRKFLKLDSNARKEMAANARNCFLTRFEIAAFARDMMGIVDEVGLL